MAHYFNKSKLKINNKKSRIITIARPGWTSIDVQIKLAKKLVDKFDLIIFWEGQNDYSRISARIKGAAALKQFDNNFSDGVDDILRDFQVSKRIIHLSSFYQVLVILLNKFNEYISTKHINTPNKDLEVSVQKIIVKSEGELGEKIATEQLYAEELNGLAKLAHKNNTKLIILTIANNDLWPPSVSSIESALLEEAVLKSKELTRALIDKNIFEHRQILSSCSHLYSNLSKAPAIFLYHLGINLLLTKKEISYFDDAFNLDLGLIPGRSNQRARTFLTTSLSNNNNSVVYDLDFDFKLYFTNPYIYESLFSDLQHLSSIGNLMVFSRVLELIKILEFDIKDSKILNILNSSVDITTKFDLIIKDYNFLRKLNQQKEKILLNSLKWHISISKFYPHHEELFIRCLEIQKNWKCVNSITNPIEVQFWEGLSNLVVDFSNAKLLLQGIKISYPDTYRNLLLTVSETGSTYLELVRFLFYYHGHDFSSLDLTSSSVFPSKKDRLK